MIKTVLEHVQIAGYSIASVFVHCNESNPRYDGQRFTTSLAGTKSKLGSLMSISEIFTALAGSRFESCYESGSRKGPRNI